MPTSKSVHLINRIQFLIYKRKGASPKTVEKLFLGLVPFNNDYILFNTSSNSFVVVTSR